jgi:glycosyltransferase involved in cell wall biosynthesis
VARVVFLMTHAFEQWKNGADAAVRGWVEQLRERGHTCELHVVLRDGDYRVPTDVTVHRISTPAATDHFDDAREVTRALHDHVRAIAQCDAVIVPWGAASLGRLAAAYCSRVMVVVQNGNAAEAMDRESYEGVDIATVSPMTAQSIERKLGRKVHVVLNAIPEAPRTDRRGDAIGMVNICGEKGAVIFLNIAANMPERRFLATGGWSGNAQLFAEMATGLPNVDIIPPQEDMDAFYSRTRLVLVPSLWPEAFGRVAMEAQTRGIPVVCTDRCAAKDFIDGIVVPVRSPTPGISANAYYRDGSQHAETIKGFLDAIVTASDAANYEILTRNALAAAERYRAQVVTSMNELSAWLRFDDGRARIE